MKDIKNLIFDFGGVLINLDRTACRETFEKLGIESIHESVLDDYRQKELYMQLESGNISAAAFRASMRRLSDQDLTDQQIDDAWVSILGDIPDYKLDWLLELRKQYHILLLSNTNDSQDKTVFLKTRVPEKLLQDFRLALAINNETTQDVIQRLISDYIKHTKITPEQLAKFTEH